MRVFLEKQWFNQWWLWVMFTVVFGICLIEPIKKVSESGTFSINHFDIGFWIGFTVIIGVIILFKYLVLHTEINDGGITYQFVPFHASEKRIKWNEIERCYGRKYRPISEFGGWGVRMGSKGGAYNVKGNLGIQIEFKNGKKLLIGTQKPKEAQQTIDRYFKTQK